MEVFSISVAIRDRALSGTAFVRTAIESAGGVITGARQLSSWAISLIIEIPGHKLSDLMDRLPLAGAIWLDDSAQSRLRARASALAQSPSDDVIVLMHVEFINDEPEHRIKVPAVPG